MLVTPIIKLPLCRLRVKNCCRWVKLVQSLTDSKSEQHLNDLQIGLFNLNT